MIKNQCIKARAVETRVHKKQPMDWSELHRAVDSGNLKRIEKLAQDPLELHTRDKEGRGALHVAVSRGNAVAANLLLKAGAHVDAQDVAGVSPLHIAVESNNVLLVKLLVNFNASPDIKNDLGETPRSTAHGKPLMEEVLEESYGPISIDTFDSSAVAAKYFGLGFKR